MQIQIRGRWYTPEPYIDEDIATIANRTNPQIPRQQRERDAAQTLRLIFPKLPIDLTRGDRLWLHNTEIVQITEELSKGLLGDRHFEASLAARLKNRPGSKTIMADFARLQRTHGEQDTPEDDYADADETEYEDADEDYDEPPVAQAVGFANRPPKAPKQRRRNHR